MLLSSDNGVLSRLVMGLYFDDGVGGLGMGLYFDDGVSGLGMELCLIIGCLLLCMKLVSLFLFIGVFLKDNCNGLFFPPVVLELAFSLRIAANAPFLLGSFLSGVMGLSL